MIELILLGAAAVSIATIAACNNRHFAPVPARVRKRQR
jgi:hypothetical protein